MTEKDLPQVEIEERTANGKTALLLMVTTLSGCKVVIAARDSKDKTGTVTADEYTYRRGFKITELEMVSGDAPHLLITSQGDTGMLASDKVARGYGKRSNTIKTLAPIAEIFAVAKKHDFSVPKKTRRHQVNTDPLNLAAMFPERHDEEDDPTTFSNAQFRDRYKLQK